MAGPFSFELFEIDPDTWGMIYNEATTTELNLATATKTTPHVWTNYAGNPILSVASGNIRAACILNDGGTFYLLYDTAGQFCLASGSDVTSLTKHSVADVPVFSGTGVPGSWERYVRHPCLLKIGATYHMWYDGRSDAALGELGAMGHATSSDMISWTRDSANNPCLSPVGLWWERADVGHPNVTAIDGVYYMFYAGYDGRGTPYWHAIGCATADNPSGPWVRCADNPVLQPALSGWELASIEAPCLRIEDDGTRTLYYAGRSDALTSAIGFALWTP